ncbi:MAG: MBL fold metallo-hydrolase [Bryobacteraceae bacterium]|nr:MBL fold metallo-hydrolase [Bryobacteraceae bacterium]
MILSLALLLLAAEPHPVESVKVRILSTMLTDTQGFGEWGFAALVEAGGHRILFDTGAHPETVLRNLAALKVDVGDIEEVILSHHHLDHTAGLVTLREAFMKRNPKALSVAYVGQGIFYPRPGAQGAEGNPMPATRTAYESAGGRFVELTGPRELHPGIWLTGPVPRKYPERNWSGSGTLRLPDGKSAEDNLPEDQTLVIETAQGLVVIAGCSHAGIVNILEYARAKIRPGAPIHAAIGGFHLFAAKEETLAWTAGKLKEFGLRHLLGAHCTGIEAVYRLRELTGLTRQTAAVGALGGGFDLKTGLSPGSIAR